MHSIFRAFRETKENHFISQNLYFQTAHVNLLPTKNFPKLLNTLWKYKSTLSKNHQNLRNAPKKIETHKYIFQEHKCVFFENTKVYSPRTKAQMWTSQLQCKNIFPKILKVHLWIANVKMQKLIFTHATCKVQEYTVKTNNKPLKSEKMRERRQHTFWSQNIVFGASKFAHKSCEEQACSSKTKRGAFKKMCFVVRRCAQMNAFALKIANLAQWKHNGVLESVPLYWFRTFEFPGVLFFRSAENSVLWKWSYMYWQLGFEENQWYLD